MKAVVFFKDGRVIFFTDIELPKEDGSAVTFTKVDAPYYNLDGVPRKGHIAILKNEIERIEVIF